MLGALALPLLLAAAPAFAVECGETVTGRARLDRDVVCTTDPALTIDGGRIDVIAEVRTGPGDMGRVIGRRGRTARSIRTVAQAAADEEGITASVEFED